MSNEGGGYKSFGGGKKLHEKHGRTSKPASSFSAPKPSIAKKSSGKTPSFKNRMRSLDRLLRQESLDPRARAAKQTELTELKQGKTLNQQQELERKYSVRYHKIKFFERVKVERSIKQLKKGAEGREQTAEESQKLAELQADLQYVLHFPKGEKYVSIIKNADEPSAQAVLDKDRSRLRLLVLKQLRETAAVADADEGQALLSSVTAGLTSTHTTNAAAASHTPESDSAAAIDKLARKAARKAAAAAATAAVDDSPEEPEAVHGSKRQRLSSEVDADADVAEPKAPSSRKKARGSSRDSAAAVAPPPEADDEDDFFMDVEEGDEVEAARAAGVRGDGGSAGGGSSGRNGLLDAGEDGESEESEEEEEKPKKRERGGRKGQAAASSSRGGKPEYGQRERDSMEPHTSAASFLGHKIKSQMAVASAAGVSMDAAAQPSKTRAEGGRKRKSGKVKK